MQNDIAKIDQEFIDIVAPLTKLQFNFTNTYFKQEEKNQRQAYIQAGGKAKKLAYADAQASQLIRNPKVKRYLNYLRKGVAAETLIEVATAVREYAKVAFSNIKDYMWVDDEENVHFKSFEQIDDDKLAAIESIKVRTNTTTNRDDSREYTTTTTEFKLHSKLSALDAIMKHLGGYEKDNKQKGDKPVLIVNFADIDINA
jgi:phage terminase small subunit